MCRAVAMFGLARSRSVGAGGSWCFSSWFWEEHLPRQIKGAMYLDDQLGKVMYKTRTKNMTF